MSYAYVRVDVCAATSSGEIWKDKKIEKEGGNGGNEEPYLSRIGISHSSLLSKFLLLLMASQGLHDTYRRCYHHLLRTSLQT
jgi:hypothetical protein